MPLGSEKSMFLGASAGGWKWDLIDSNCSSTTDGGTWSFNSGSVGSGGASQTTFDGQSTFHVYSGGTAADGAYGSVTLNLADSDLSSATTWPEPFTMEARIYLHTIGTFGNGANTDDCQLNVNTQKGVTGIRFTPPYPGSGSGAPYGTRNESYGGGTYPLIGAITDNWVGSWHTFGIYAHSFASSSPYIQYDVYADGTLISQNQQITTNNSYTATVVFNQKGYNTSNRQSYIDWIRVGTGDGRSVLTA
ncbi:MAG: hypothetical protein QF704_09730 [Anaerolineales bacterium]|nr:hypothetical protein [Anaerolineales bacterium]